MQENSQNKALLPKVKASPEIFQAISILEERRLRGDDTTAEMDAIFDQVIAQNALSADDEGHKSRVGRFLENLRLVDSSVQRSRIEHCRKCEHGQRLGPSVKSNALIRCRKCGCVMDAKTKFSGGKCPIGKFV